MAESATEQKHPDRLVVVETVYYQQTGQQPLAIETRFSKPLESREQLYQRQLKTTQEWESLDVGWIKSVGMLLLKNCAGKDLQENPSEQLAAEIASSTIELGIPDCQSSFTILVPPGESARFCPSSLDLLVRCKNVANVPYVLTLIPG